MDCDSLSLHYETVTPLLLNTLTKLMSEPLFNPFVLVGGTNLSLYFGHRRSDDIDLFTDVEYGSLDYKSFEEFLSSSFPYYDRPDKSEVVGFGRSYYVGQNEHNAIKLDLMYTDTFFEPYSIIDNIRMATINQIAAMKMQAIFTGGRKKDWWDIDRLLDSFSISQLFDLHKKWQPWTHNTDTLIDKLLDFSEADKQVNPKCLMGKEWDNIKLHIIFETRKMINTR